METNEVQRPAAMFNYENMLTTPKIVDDAFAL
jgi:hypothetical protein